MSFLLTPKRIHELLKKGDLLSLMTKDLAGQDVLETLFEMGAEQRMELLKLSEDDKGQRVEPLLRVLKLISAHTEASTADIPKGIADPFFRELKFLFRKHYSGPGRKRSDSFRVDLKAFFSVYEAKVKCFFSPPEPEEEQVQAPRPRRISNVDEFNDAAREGLSFALKTMEKFTKGVVRDIEAKAASKSKSKVEVICDEATLERKRRDQKRALFALAQLEMMLAPHRALETFNKKLRLGIGPKSDDRAGQLAFLQEIIQYAERTEAVLMLKRLAIKDCWNCFVDLDADFLYRHREKITYIWNEMFRWVEETEDNDNKAIRVAHYAAIFTPKTLRTVFDSAVDSLLAADTYPFFQRSFASFSVTDKVQLLRGKNWFSGPHPLLTRLVADNAISVVVFTGLWRISREERPAIKEWLLGTSNPALQTLTTVVDLLRKLDDQKQPVPGIPDQGVAQIKREENDSIRGLLGAAMQAATDEAFKTCLSQLFHHVWSLHENTGRWGKACAGTKSRRLATVLERIHSCTIWRRGPAPNGDSQQDSAATVASAGT